MVVKEVVFLAFIILPVYELVVLGDAIIFNLIEFITGSNPLASHRVEADGATVRFERTPRGVDVVIDDGVKVTQRSFVRRHGGWEIVDAQGALIARLVRVDGRLEVVDAAGQPLAAIDEAQLERATDAFYAGGIQGLAGVVSEHPVWAMAR